MIAIWIFLTHLTPNIRATQNTGVLSEVIIVDLGFGEAGAPAGAPISVALKVSSGVRCSAKCRSFAAAA